MADRENEGYVLIYSKKDRDTVLGLQLSLEDLGITNGCLYDDDFGSEMDNVAKLVNSNKWILLFITKNFLADGVLKMYKNESLLASLRKDTRKVIPVYAQDKDIILTEENKVNLFGLDILEGLNMTHDNAVNKLYSTLRHSPTAF